MTIMKTSLSGHRKIIDNVTRWHFQPLTKEIHAWTRGGAPGGDSLGARAGVRPLAGPGGGCGTADCPDLDGSVGAPYEDVLAPRKGRRGSGGWRGSGARLPRNLQWLRKH